MKLIPNELSAKFADPAVKRQLMAEFGDAGPFSGVNEEGEQVLVSITPRSIKTGTFQKNGWVRLNWFDENGDPAGESFDGRWNQPEPVSVDVGKVHVVVCNDVENGVVSVDVFAKKKDAQKMMRETHEMIESGVREDQNMYDEHDSDGLVYFAHRIGEDEVLYECSLREEVVQ